MVQQALQNKNPWQILKPGRVYFNYGPVSMVVSAEKYGEPLTDLCCQSFAIIDSALKEISTFIEILRLYPNNIRHDCLSGLPLQMLEAVRAVGEPTLTPMAAVAGLISDIVADWLFANGASKVMVNNGGDIALRLAQGESVSVGLVSSLRNSEIDRIVNIKAEHGIGGIATSGLGGRGFTRGIAQGVSVLAPNATIADALATHMANSSFIHSDKVITTKAGNINPLSDIKDLSIVVGVDELTEKEEKSALRNIELEAIRQKEKGNLIALCVRIQKHTIELYMPL